MAGETFFSNVPEGAKLADSLSRELLLLEGSGSAIPPVFADASAIVVSAGRGTGYVTDYFGPFRMARADLAIIAFAEQPIATPDEVEAVRAAIASVRPGIPVVATVFRPKAIESVTGKRVMFATTAPEAIVPKLAEHLSATEDCEVVATTPHLSNRALLRADLARHAGQFDVLVTELKAAAIDVVAAAGEEAGVPTVLCDNVPVSVDGANLDELVSATAMLALARGRERKANL